MDDWVHGDEGTTDWNEVMAREDMIVGGPAVRLDTTVLSSMRPHRAAAPPVGVPVVKLFAVVGLVGATYDPMDDRPRFGSLPLNVAPDRSQNQVETRFATGQASPKKQRREDLGSSHPGGQPFTAMHEHLLICACQHRESASVVQCAWCPLFRGLSLYSNREAFATSE